LSTTSLDTRFQPAIFGKALLACAGLAPELNDLDLFPATVIFSAMALLIG